MFFDAAERFATFLRDEPDVNNLILRLRFVPNMDINLQPEELVTSKAQQ